MSDHCSVNPEDEKELLHQSRRTFLKRSTAAAVANAVYHATGTRIRELSITLDKMM